MYVIRLDGNILEVGGGVGGGGVGVANQSRIQEVLTGGSLGPEEW